MRKRFLYLVLVVMLVGIFAACAAENGYTEAGNGGHHADFLPHYAYEPVPDAVEQPPDGLDPPTPDASPEPTPEPEPQPTPTATPRRNSSPKCFRVSPCRYSDSYVPYIVGE